MAAKRKKKGKPDDAARPSTKELAPPFDFVSAEFLTKDELIKYLKISRPTINRMMKAHEIPFIKLARRVLFRKADIDKFLDSKTVK